MTYIFIVGGHAYALLGAEHGASNIYFLREANQLLILLMPIGILAYLISFRSKRNMYIPDGVKDAQTLRKLYCHILGEL